jgi:hypothetical protein
MNADDRTRGEGPPGDSFDDLLQAGLFEVLGGEKPPDVASRVAARLAQHPQRPRSGRRRLPLAAAAALAAGIALFAMLRRDSLWADVGVSVATGRCEWHGRDGVLALQQGDQRELRLRIADVLRTQDSPASLALAGFGRLDMQRTTELKVESMMTRKIGNRVVAGAITFAVIGGGVVWYATSGGSERAAHGETLHVEAGTQPEGTGALAAKELEAENRRLRERITELEAARQRQAPDQPANPSPADVEPAKPAAPAALAAAIADPKLAAALEAIDWRTFGESMQQMVPLMAQLAAALEKGEMGPEFLEVAGKLQQLNGKLVEQAKVLVDHKVPGAGINGAFTHPSIAANQVAAVLEIAGQPLAAEQRLRLTELAQRYAAQDEAERGAASGQDFQLEGVLREVELKDRFYAEVASALTPEQQQQLWSDRTKGRNGFDLFGSGVVWAQFARVEDVADRADFAKRMHAGLADKLGVSGANADKLRAVVDAWSQAWPADTWTDKSDSLAHAMQVGTRPVKTSRIAAAAKRQIALMREIMAQVPLTPEARKRLAESRAVFVPIGR